jgi:excisionase family DNA binding protein
MKRYLTIEEVSAYLHMQVGTARNRLSRGEPMPPSVKIGRRRLFPEDDFQEWLDSFLRNNDPIISRSQGS